MTSSVRLTRVHRSGRGGLKNQRLFVDPTSVTTLRPSNAAGVGHRSTITIDGQEFNLSNEVNEAARLLGFQ